MSNNQNAPLSTIDAIEQRRSVKHYDPAHKMSEAEIQKLISLTALAPTSFNIQPNRFVVVTDPAMKAEVRKLSYDQPQVSEASALFIIAGNTKAFENPARYWPGVPEEALKGIVGSITGAYEGQLQRQHDEAILSGGLGGATLMLAAKAMGYDTCPMKGFDFPAMAKFIKLPKDYVIVMMVAVGKKAEEPHERIGTLPVSEILFRNHF